MKTLTGGTRKAFLLFFASHIPITAMIDAQALLPSWLFPQPIIDMLHVYTSTFKDSLMTAPFDTWFQAVIAAECIFQVPFFFVAIYALSTDHRVDGKGWFRTLCLIYGAHTTTVLLPILTCVSTDAKTNLSEKAVLLAFYFPYFIFPLWLMFIAATSDDVFGRENATSTKAKTF